MSGKVTKVKILIISTIIFVILASQLAGGASVPSNEMLDMINKGETITIELAQPDYEVDGVGEVNEGLDWIMLDQLKTYNNGFRQDFDEIFNINIVTENGIDGKSGSLYVDQDGDRNGNTTLRDAFRNKAFINRYWKDTSVKKKLADVSSGAYEDVGSGLELRILASLNAYYNLLPDGKNPASFNETSSLSREEFYSLVYKSEQGVSDISIDSSFEKAIGGATKYSKYAQEVDEYGFLSVENKSLDGNSIASNISRGEAIYLIVNKYFQEELVKVDVKDKAYSDTKNASDLALKLGFKDKDKKEVTSKDRWQSYTLAYMCQNPESGMQEEMYKAMIVSKNLGLIAGDTSRWDEPISKSEAIQLMVNTFSAENELYGYLSELEYGKINVDKFTSGVASEIGLTDDGLAYGDGWVEAYAGMVPVDGSTILNDGRTLLDMKADFEMFLEMFKSEGISNEDIQIMLEEMATINGTTVENVFRAKDMGNGSVGGGSSYVPAPVEEPSYTPAPVEQPSYVPAPQPSGNGGGGYPITESDKNGNGLSDFLEEAYLDGIGEAGRDDDFHME